MADHHWHGNVRVMSGRYRRCAVAVAAILLLWRAPAAKSDVTTGLVGHWKLNESGGATAADSSGNDRHGTFTNGPVLNQTGQCSSAVSFDGSNDYVNIADHADFSKHTSTGQTVAAWVKVTTIPAASGQQRVPIVAKGNSGVWEWALYVYRRNATTWYPGASYWQQSGSSHNEIGSSSNAFGTGVWVHMAMTYEPGGTVKLYVNGTLATMRATPSGSPYDGVRPVQIGRREDGQYLAGVIDDVRIYQRALTATDVTELHGLLLHEELNETSGSVAADSSAYERSGTVTGTATWTSGTPLYRGFTFDGATKIETSGLLGSPSSITVATWANLAAADTGGSDAVSLGDRVYVRLDESSATKVVIKGGGGAVSASISQAYAGTGWHHFAGVFDNAGNSLKLYVDGVLAATTTTTDNIQYTGGGSNTVLGRNGNSGTDNDFTGSIDDVRVYNYALTAVEIAELYGLLGRWKLVETTGTTADDQTLLANDGTYANGVSLATSALVPGYGAVAATFDGVDDYVNVANESDFDITGPITVAAWIRGDLFSGDYASFVTKGGYAWRLRYRPTIGKLSFKCTGLSSEEVLSDGALLPNRWYHVAGVYTGSELQLYINGVQNNAVSSTGNISTNDYAVNLARNAQQAGRNFKGAIYDARVYNRALCPTEISQLYGSAFNGAKIIKWEEIQ